MFQSFNNGWFWHFRSPDDRANLPGNPAWMTPDGELVKSSDVRQVFRRNGYFIKVCFRGGFWPALREYRTLRRLQKNHIPAVEPVAWGASGRASCLITRELSGSESVQHYFYRTAGRENRPVTEFLDGFSRFLRQLLNSGLNHPDLHGGNILYREKDGVFALVDVLGVRKAFLPGRKRMTMILREFAEFSSKETLLELAVRCGVPEPETFYRDMFRWNAELLRHEWKKRRRQFLHDYPKFIFCDGELRRISDGTGGPLPMENTRRIVLKPEEAKALALQDFRLGLLRIPRLRVAAFDKQGNLWQEKGNGAANAGDAGMLRERLFLSGLEPENYTIETDRFGRPAAVVKR